MGRTREKRSHPVADAAERCDATDRLDESDETREAAGTPASLDAADLEEDIRRRAYARYLTRGNAQGSELDDWCAAEREVREARRSGR